MKIQTIEVKKELLPVLLNRLLISKSIYKENFFSINCVRCSVSLKLFLPFCLDSGCSRQQTHSLCVDIVSHRSQVHQNVPSNRSFTSSVSLSLYIFRIRNTFWLKPVRLNISHDLESQTRFPGHLGRNDVTLSGLAVEHLFKMATTDAPSLETNFSG